MEKILTISIAAYNVEKYLEETLKSLLVPNMEKLEVLIVNDGSKDNTEKIALEFEKKYPNTFKLINKQNGGYGSTINAGIKNARGKYFKQLDGDDWYNTNNLSKIIDKLETINTDVVYTPYIVVRENQNTTELVYNTENRKYENIDDFLKNAAKISMHNLMYKTELLKSRNILIDENCFYTDTEYVVYPILYSKDITTISEPLYMYRLGIEGQSISYEGRIKHYKDHINVCNKLTNTISDFQNISKEKQKYLYEYISEMLATCIGGFLILLLPTKENYNKIIEFDNNIKEKNIDLYNLMHKYSKSVGVIRKNSYLKYKLLYYYKSIRRKIS